MPTSQETARLVKLARTRAARAMAAERHKPRKYTVGPDFLAIFPEAKRLYAIATLPAKSRGRPKKEQEGSHRVPGKKNGTMKAVPPRRSGNKVRRLADHLGSGVPWTDDGTGRNARTVWTVATQPFKGAHFATFPPALIEPCILAGCPLGGLVLDPFLGAGTTALVANRLGRNCVGIELNPAYVEMASRRVTDDSPLFSSVVQSADAPLFNGDVA